MRLPSLLATLLLGASSAGAAEKNVIFFITDDESPTLGCYGDDAAATPAIDALAADGTVFLNAFATTASCSASRSVVMSGLHNHLNGQFGHQHHYHKFGSFYDVAQLALPRVMAEEGYRTGHIGKYHVAPEVVYHFETYVKGNGRNAVEMAENVREFITSKEDERPFFLYFGTSDPHRGGGKDQNAPGKHKPDLFGNRPNQGNFEGVEEVIYDPNDVIVPPFLPDTEACRLELAHYYQSVARIDQGVARLVSILKEADLYDKTMIVFTSDHGMAFQGGKTTVFEGGLRVPFVVRNPYEKKRGVRSEALLSHVDITPSILDFAGGLDSETNGPTRLRTSRELYTELGLWKFIEKENRNGGRKFTSYHGRSWMGILGEEDDLSRDSIHASHTFHEIQMYYPMRVYRDRKYKLIWNIAHGLPYPSASDLWSSSTWLAQWDQGEDAPYGQMTVGEYMHRPAFELYDIEIDPWESTNLAENPEHAETLEAYQAKLKKFQRDYHDPWVMKWDYE